MTLAKPITPHLWFDTQATEAAEFYCALFPESRIDSVTRLRDTPSGDCDVVAFTLHGQPFMAISAGPEFKCNPSISFFIHFDPRREPDADARLQRTWDALSNGGKVLMDLGEYPFSTRYGWVQDRYGVSWQLMRVDADSDVRPPIMPSLMFTGDVAGQAEDAGAFYRSVFEDAREGQLARYPDGDSADAGTVMYSDFQLDGNWFAAMDSAHPHGFAFNEAISFVIHCRDQAELDRYWAQLSSVPEAEQCGWCKDRFGVSWQITPIVLDTLMTSGDQAVVDRVTRAFLDMKKLDVAAIERAGRGE